MTELPPIDVGRYLACVWGKLMMQKQFNNALLTGFLGHLVALETQDAELKSGAATWIEKTMQEFTEAQNDKARHAPESSHTCSFCGRGESEVRLAAGAKAFICNSCVTTLNEFFSKEKKNDDPA
jgi:ClpX C4-type zinc finger